MDDQHKSVLKLKHECADESVHYPVVYESMPEEFQRIAERELNETEENKRKGLQKLKDIMKKESKTVLEDDMLLAILRNSKFNLKKSETKLKQFLHKRREIIKKLMEIDNIKVQNVIDGLCFGILPYRDKHGRVIIYSRAEGYESEKYEVQDLGVIAAVASLFILKYPITTVSGYAYFAECKSFPLYLFYPFLRSLKQTVLYFLSFPARASRVEILNETSLHRYILKIMSPLVSRKILSRVSCHGEGYGNLHKFYDPNILPEIFGGNMGGVSNEAYKQKLLEFVEELKNENDCNSSGLVV